MDDDNEIDREGGWLERMEDFMYDRISTEKSPKKVRNIMETIACSHTPMTGDGRTHGSEIDEKTKERLASLKGPTIDDYRRRLQRWGVDPKRFPLMPTREWAMEAFAPPTRTDDYIVERKSEEDDEWNS